jgi:YegS/Rv2252/BmrU family lipid kinase
VALLIRKAMLIANPASRRGARLARHAHRALANRVDECDVLLTERPGHAAELASNHGGGYDAVFVLGGDGTVMEVAGALAEQRLGIPIGVLAGGTGNLVARALGIPLSIDKAVPALLSGDDLVIDLGRLDTGRRFAIAAGVGIDAAMIAETPGWLKRRLGVLAYAIMGSRAAIRAIVRGDFFEVRIEVDGVPHERRVAAVMIANFGAVLGERLTLGPEIHTDDGLLDGVLFSPRSLGDAVRIMWRMYRRDFRSDPCVLYVRGREIRIQTTPVKSWQADGELMGTTPFCAVVEPLALRLLVPHRG